MEEIWDLYDENKNLLGKTAIRGKDTLNPGEYHIVVDAIIINDKNEILITKRSSTKPSYPLLWECNGGAVKKGETSKEGIIREMKEEIGIDVDFNHGKLLFSEVISKSEKDNVKNNKIRDVYVFYQNVLLDDIVFQDGEACDKKYVTIDQFKKMYDNCEITPNSIYVMNNYERILDERF